MRDQKGRKKTLRDSKRRILATAENVFTEESNIELETERSEVVGWDSLGNLKLMMALEDEFEVVFDDDDFANVSSIKDLYDSVVSKLE